MRTRCGETGPACIKPDIESTLAHLTALAFCLGVLTLAPGCASSRPSDETKSSTANGDSQVSAVKLRQDHDINGVWLEPGFDFNGYDRLLIEPTSFHATERPNEVQMRAMAVRVLRDEMRSQIEQTSVFGQVTTRAEDLQAGKKALRMSNTIVEYEKGGGGARYFAGVFGGGQPVIKIRGEIKQADKLLCVYEMRRSGESVGARMGGVFMSDEEIQRNDIRDLATDFASFIKRTASAQPAR